MANEFNILTQVKADTTPAQKTYDAWKKNIESKALNIELNLDTKSWQAVSKNFKDIVTTVENANKSLSNNATNKAWKDLTNSATSLVTETNKYINSQNQLVTVTKKVDSELGTVITRTKEYKNEIGQTVKETKTYSGNNTLLHTSIEKIGDETKDATNNFSKYSSTLNNVSTNTESLANKIVTAAGKVALFKVSTTIVMGFYNAIGEAKDAIMDFDAALTEFKKVSDLSGEALDDYTKKLGELGEAVARSREQMVDAATEFKKSGFSNEQSAELAQIASLYQNVADSELSAGDSASYIISQMKAFGMTTTAEAQSIIDKTNEVANSYAVSSTDISQALTKTSSAMAAYGNTIDESIALTTAGAEILNGNVGKVAKGLRSIGANVTNLAAASDSMQISVDGSLKTIQLIDETTGDMLSTYDVLAQISQYWDDMNSSEQSQLALTLANKTQFEVFTSVLSNFTTAEDALTTSLNSQGSAWKENEAFLQSNEASINSIKASFQELILNSQLDEFVKLVLQATAGLMKFTNSGLGQVLISMGLVYVTLNLVNKGWTTFTNKLQQAMIAEYGLDAATLSVSGSMGILTQSFLANAAAWAATPFGMITIAIGAIAGIVTAFNYFNETVDEANENLNELAQASNQVDGELEELPDKISSLNKEISELEEKQLGITDPEDSKELDSQLQKLKEQKKELEAQVLILKEKQKYAHIDEEEQAVDTAGKKQDSQTLVGYGQVSGTAQEQLDAYIDAYKYAANKIREINQKLVDENVSLTTSQKDKLAEQKAMYQQVMTDAEQYASDMADEVQTINDSIYSDATTKLTDMGYQIKQSNQESIDSYMETFGSGLDLTQTYEEQLQSLIETTGKSKEEIEEYAEANGYLADEEGEVVEGTDEYTAALIDAALAMERGTKQADGENTSLQDLSSTLTTLASDYQSLQSAVDDYNNGGTMSLETLDALINAATNYSGCLELQNGKLVLSKQYFEALAQQKIANAKADLVMETQTKLATLAEQSQGEVISQTSGVIDTSKASVDDICISLQNMTGDAITAAQAWNVLKGSMSNEDAGNLEYQQKINEIRDEFTVQWKTLDEIGSQISGNFDGYASSIAKSSGSAASSSKDAWLEAYKAEKETIDAMYENGTLSAEQYQEKLLELQAKYLTDTKEHQEKYASEIKSLYEDIYKALKDSVKDSLDEMKDAHDKAEDALKKQHEAQEKSIKNQIELLKRQKEAVEDSYDAQIEALKREREEYENQLELMKLKESLAKAQQQYQYVMNENGRFEWTQDQNAVDEAQEELYEEQLKQAYEKQLQDLEDAKDAAVALYEQQIQDLEDYYDQVQEANDEAEEALEAHNEAIEEQYEKAIEDFDLYAEMLNNGQLAQIESENANWATRLTNLAQFVNSYNAMLAELGNEGATVSASANFSSGSASNSSSKTTSGSTTKFTMKKGIVIDVPKHASGVSSISDDELALVGDSPNQELVIGSKLNGVPLSLSSGSGVVNAKSTRSLAGLLNSIPNLGNNYNTTNNNSQHSIHIDTINLPQVQNGNDFVDYLQNFNVDMTANAYRFGS